jgi:tetratricopeptide (TPR) repeat protein
MAFRVAAQTALAALLLTGPLAARELLPPWLIPPPPAGQSHQDLFDQRYADGLRELTAGNLDAADTAFLAAALLRPDSVLPALGRADVAWRRGNLPAVEAHLQRALRLAPTVPAPRHAWARFLATTGRTDAALDAYRETLRLDPRNVGARIDQADLLVTARADAAAAEPLYREALDLAPDHAGARYALGNALLLLDRLDEARTEVTASARLEPQNALPLHLLGVIELRRGDQAAALDAFDRGLALAPGAPALRVARGDLLLARGTPERALADFSAALAAQPGLPAALAGSGQANQALGRLAMAEAQYRQVLATAPRHPVALNNLAWLAVEQGRNLDEAEALARRAVAVVPRVAEVHGTLGWVLRAKGDLAGAAGALETAAGLRASPQLLVNLGTVYLELGRRREALGAAERALGIDPGFAAGQALRQRALQSG